MVNEANSLLETWHKHKVWIRWNKLHKDLSDLNKFQLAGVFKGHVPDGFAKNPGNGIVYVGKATAGPFDYIHANKEYFGCNKKAFWRFARRLNALCGGIDKEKPEMIAWSNCCRIGDAKHNPNLALYNAQEELAAETLRLEWEHLRPRLVVCAAEGFYEDIFREAFGVRKKWLGCKTVIINGECFYYRRRVRSEPSFLLMKHPQIKSTEYLDSAFEVAKQLYEGKTPIDQRRTG